MNEFCRVHIRKEALKFSSAHMTVFPDGTKERLHGHNYRTELTVEFTQVSFETMIPFAEFKSAMKKICEAWDEKVLIADRCPFFELLRDESGEFEFKLCGKHYLLPSDEVELLHVDNIVTETLAQEFSKRLRAAVKPELLSHVRRLELRVEEMLGQGSTYVCEMRA